MHAADVYDYAIVRVVPRVQLVRWLRRQPEVLDDVTIAAIYEAARRSTTWGT